MSERNINSSIKTALINNDDFSYAHLVKFERPFALKNGETRTDANRYAYYTDGATDIVFDDGSGNGAQTYRANRITSVGQYSETIKARATSMSLTLAAEDLGASVEIAGTLNTSGVFTPTSSVHNGEPIDFVQEGFKEGDIIKFSYSSTTLKYVITGFTTNNSVITTARTGTDSDDSSFPGSNLTQTFTIEQDSIELNAALMDRGITATNTSNASPNFVNREVFVHKIFIDPETGTLLGGNTSSVLIFKGIIASVNIDEGLTGSKVKWNLTSHWGDFEEVNGRLTTDEVHRALDANKIAQIESAVRPEYAADLGFMHSETSLSAIANYKTQEKRWRMKSKKRGGLAGAFGGKKYYQEEYQVDIQNEVDLNVHLQGKYLPVVYGVQRINGNPIFADTLNDNNKIVYTADAICEGEIHGLYNIYIDDVPLICTDDNDYDVRNVTNGSDKDNTQLQCFGRMSRGNTLNGKVWAGGSEVSSSQADWDLAKELGMGLREAVEAGLVHYMDRQDYRDYVSVPALSAGNASGLEHGAVYDISHPYTIQQQFMHGRPNQKASDMLVAIAEASNGVGSISILSKGYSYESPPNVTISGGGGSGATATARLGSAATDDAGKVRSITITNRGSGYTSSPTVSISGGGGSGARASANLGGFKRQTDYWSSNMPYWSPSHRLLDTAYSSMKFVIDADSTTIPEIEYVVKGKVLDCYNYDNSYTPDKALGASDNADNFTSGDLVTVETSTNGSSWAVDTTGTHASNKFKIMHKWLFTTSRGTAHYRFRLDTTPNLGLVNGRATDKTRLRLKDGSGNYWHMLTWDHEIIGETTFPNEWVAAGSNISTTGNGTLTISGISNANKTKLGTSDPRIQFYADDLGEAAGLKYAVLKGTWSGSGDANVLTFANTDYSGVTFPNDIEIRNAVEFDMTSISTIANITDATETLASSYTDSHGNTIFERGALLHNLTTGESREIVAFGTGNDILEIETPFLTPPYSNHKFKIDGSGADKRASSNPAIQTLDFVMNKKYGRGLEEKELDISSFITSAKLCDARSDITIRLTGSPSGVQPGDIFQITHDGSSSGTHVASGTVATGGVDTTNNTITLTKVVNKFAKKFAEHVSYKPGDIVYTSAGNFFRATAAGSGSNTEPTSSTSKLTLLSGTVDMHKVSGSGSVNTLSIAKSGLPIDYSLYDSDWVKYWRYFGWEEAHQSEVTRHQTNFMLDTGKSVFQNINSLLTHFNGVLSYENGKYVLDVETQENAPTASLSNGVNTNPYYIDETDIIGKIGVVDNSQKNGKNTIKASLADPQLNWGTRSVTFFNSDFLKADRNVVKTGSFPYTGITNYYNARINTEKELFQTRFSKEVSFELGPRGILLRPGQVLSMNYKPFGWTNKLLRIENLNFRANCNVSVKCREYDDSIYEITKQQAASISEQTSAQYGLKRPEKPTISSASTDKIGSILLTWANSEDFIEGSDSTEIWTHSSDSLDDATLLATVDNSTSYMYNAATNENVYFWIRHTRYSRGSTGNKQYIVFSDYNASAGTLGTSLAISAGAQSVKLNPSTHVIDYSKVGAESTTVNFTTTPFNMSGVLFYEFLVGTNTRQNSQTTTFTLADFTDNTADTTSGSTNLSVNSTSNYGVGMRVVGAGIPEGTTISAIVDSTNLTLSAAATASASNIEVEITDEPAVNDAPVVITVKVHQGSAGGGIVGQDSVSIFSVQDGQSAITAFLTNESHTVATAVDGSGASYTGAGGTFKVFYGNQDITTNAKVTFSAATGTNVTGTINSTTGVYTISNFTNSASNGSVVFSTLVKGSLIGGVDGTDDVTLSKTYSISKAIAGVNGTGSAGQNAKTVNLTASDYSIVYDKDGSNPTPSTSTDITLTATAVNFNDPYFKFTGDGITDETAYTNGTSGANGDEFTFQVPSSHFTDPKTLRVGVAESDADTAEVAFDTISIFAVKPGQTGAEGDDAITVICTNEAHTFPAASNGAISSFDNSGTDIEVFKGATQLTGILTGTPSTNQFKVTASASGITTGTATLVDTDSGVAGNIVRFADHSGMSNSTGVASITYSINVENSTTLTKKQTFTKSTTGAVGVAGQANAIVYAYQRSASALTSNPGNVTVALTGSNSGKITTGSLANGWQKEIPSGTNPIYVVAATAAGNGTSDTISDSEWSDPVILSKDGVTATNRATVVLYQRTTTNSAPSAGTNSGKPSGNSTYTFLTGALSLTTANGWSTTNPGVDANNPYLWVTQATALASAENSTDTIPQTEWSDIKLFSTFAADGDPGTKTAIVYAYKRSSSDLSGIVLSSAGPGAVTVSLTSGTITNSSLSNGWSKTPVASDGNPLYICVASAAGTGSTDNIAATEWTQPVEFVSDGANVTVTGSSTNSDGNTVVTFSDGSSAVISKGTDGQTQGVKVAYASDANGTNKSFTQGSLTFVKYVEYTGTAPTINNSVFNSGFVKFIGGDGTSEGVKPIYAEDASGTNASFDEGSRTFVNFYEWTGSEPSTVPSGLTYVKFIGDDGAAGQSVALVFIYKTGTFSITEVPTISGNSNYNFNTEELTNIPSGWSTTKPAQSNTYAIYRSEKAVVGTGTTNSVVWPAAELYWENFDYSPTVYARGTSSPSISNGTANPPSGWSASIPSGTDPVWSATGTLSNFLNSSYTWSAPVKLTGDTGTPGINTATIQLYKTTTTNSAPAHPDSVLTWNFANKAFTDSSSELDGWSVNAVPASGNDVYLWTTTATAAGTGATDDIAVSEWADVTLLKSALPARFANGFLYYDASTGGNTQAAPTASNYNFVTGVFGTLTSGWSINIGTAPYTYVNFTVTEATHGGTQTVTFGTPKYQGGASIKDPIDWDIIYDISDNQFQLKLDNDVLSTLDAPNALRNDQLSIPTNISDLNDIPANPGNGQFLKYNSSGGFSWSADNDTVYTLPNNVLTGASKSGQTLTLTQNDGTQVALTNTDTVYTLPDDVITGASLSGQTLTLTKNGGGTVALTNTDTVLSTSDVRGKFSGSGIDTSTGVITNTTYSTSDFLSASTTMNTLPDANNIRSRLVAAIDSSNRIIGNIYDGSNVVTPTQVSRLKGGFDNVDSGALTLKQTSLPTVPTSKGGTGVTDTSEFLNSEIQPTDITDAGGVAASSLNYGEISVSVGLAATTWSFNGTTYTPTATTQTVTLTITHPTFGTSTVVGTWTRTNLTISGFALGTASGMTGSGTNTWTFGDVDSDSGSADNNFGSTTANNALKTIYVQHSASNKRFEITAQVFTFSFSFKCLTPAMLPKNLQIGDEVDSPLGKTKVIDMQYKEREGYYILEDELEITNDHPILIDGEWILAEEYAGKKEYIDKPTEVVYVETENELLTVKDWTVGGKY